MKKNLMKGLQLSSEEKGKAIRIFLFVGLLFILSISLWLRPLPIGDDSYATLTCIREGDCERLGLQPAALIVWGLLPFNLFLFKIIQFVCLLIASAALFRLVLDRYGEQKAWLVTICLWGLSGLLLFEFGRFENEFLAYPLVFWGFYFILRKEVGHRVAGIALLCAGCLFWAGSVYLLVALAPWFEIAAALSVVAIFLFGEDLVGFLLPTGVLESRLLVGLSQLLGLLVVVPVMFRFKEGRLWLCFLIMLGFVCLQGKLVMILVPFIALGLGELMALLDKKNVNYKAMVGVLFLIGIGFNIAFLMASPTQNEWSGVYRVMGLKIDYPYYPVYNDWGIGYWLKYRGVDTNYYGSGPNPDYNNLPRPYLALTSQNLDCNLQASYPDFKTTTKVYICD